MCRRWTPITRFLQKLAGILRSYPFMCQHAPDVLYMLQNGVQHCRVIIHLPYGICHPVRPQSSHHTQLLQRALVFPFLREFLFFGTLALHELLPSLGRAFNVTIQVTEFFHVTQGLQRKTREQNLECGCHLHIDVLFRLKSYYAGSRYTIEPLLSGHALLSDQ